MVYVIMPMYNAEKYVKLAIESVLKQTYTNWILLVINDGSEDLSSQIVSDIAQKDNRIIQINLQKNAGIANARNRGIEEVEKRLNKAEENFIAFLDSDDVWKRDKLCLQIEFMQKEKVVLSYTATSFIDWEGKPMEYWREVPTMVSYNRLLKVDEIPFSSVVMQVIDTPIIKMPIVHHEDYAFLLGVCSKYEICAHGINVPLLKYRITPGSESRNKIKALKWTWEIYYFLCKKNCFESSIMLLRFCLFTSLKYLKKMNIKKY